MSGNFFTKVISSAACAFGRARPLLPILQRPGICTKKSREQAARQTQSRANADQLVGCQFGSRFEFYPMSAQSTFALASLSQRIHALHQLGKQAAACRALRLLTGPLHRDLRDLISLSSIAFSTFR